MSKMISGIFKTRIYRRPPTTTAAANRRPPSHQNSKEMTDISLWVSILGLFGPPNSMMTLDLPSADPTPAMGHPPPAVTTNFKKDDRYNVMGIDFGVIWAADFNNTIRLDVRRPARRPKVARRPPSQQNSKKMTDISL